MEQGRRRSGAIGRVGALGLWLVVVGCDCGPYDEQLARIEAIARTDGGATHDAGPEKDAGAPDAAVEDAGGDDAGSVDAGPVDAGRFVDAGAGDAGRVVDAGGATDAGEVDAGGFVSIDAGVTADLDGGCGPTFCSGSETCCRSTFSGPTCIPIGELCGL